MEVTINTFWIEIFLLLFALLSFLLLGIFSYFRKKVFEKKMEELHLEVRELKLRVSIIEARFEERLNILLHARPPSQISESPKRGRPKKSETK